MGALCHHPLLLLSRRRRHKPPPAVPELSGTPLPAFPQSAQPPPEQSSKGGFSDHLSSRSSPGRRPSRCSSRRSSSALSVHVREEASLATPNGSASASEERGRHTPLAVTVRVVHALKHLHGSWSSKPARASLVSAFTDDPSLFSEVPLRDVVLTSQLPICAMGAAHALFSTRSKYSEQMFMTIGSTDVKISSWSRDDGPFVRDGEQSFQPLPLTGAPPAGVVSPLVLVREIERRQPVKTKLSPTRITRVRERQTLGRTPKGIYVILIDQSLLDVPYGDYFTVYTKLTITDGIGLAAASAERSTTTNIRVAPQAEQPSRQRQATLAMEGDAPSGRSSIDIARARPAAAHRANVLECDNGPPMAMGEAVPLVDRALCGSDRPLYDRGGENAAAQCAIRVSVEVRFHKSTFFEKKIRTNTKEEVAESFAKALPLMHEAIAQDAAAPRASMAEFVIV